MLLADAPTQGHLDRLPVGTLVKVIYATDPWLRRYRGMRAVVGRDDGLSVDVLLSCGHLLECNLELVQIIVARFVDARRPARRPDKLARK